MKSLISLSGTIITLVLFLFVCIADAQSDYEIVQGFKQKFGQIETSINNAKNLAELNSVAEEIDRFRDDYLEHKVLLDKSLYPDNFDKMFDRLNMKFVIRNQDFTTIDVLQTENLQLKEQVDLLNKTNTDLLNKVQEYEYTYKKDAKKIAELEKLVTQLKSSLDKRDKLIYSIVDSLMPQLRNTNITLSKEERGQVYVQAEKNNLIANIKKALQDNIRFMQVTSLLPDDLERINEQQKEFSNFWQYAGVNLIDIYAGKNEKTREITNIDSLFSKWQNSLEQESWTNIRNEFSTRGINLTDFTNGDEFEKTTISFIDEAIKNIGTKGTDESEQTYSMFADSTWFSSIKSIWIPYLEKHEMLNPAQVVRIENKISDWKGRLTPASFDWVYVLVAIIAVAGIGFMNRKRLFKRNNSQIQS